MDAGSLPDARPSPASVVTARATREDPVDRMAREVREGLLSTPRSLPSKYFYDERGSALFDEITRLPEYYLTRAEAEILDAHADDLAAAVRPVELFELGSGSGTKTRRIVEAARRAGRLATLTFFDVDAQGMRAALDRLGEEFPGLSRRGFAGDFETDLGRVEPLDGRLAMLLGSTIGNMEPTAEAPELLASVRGRLGRESAFLVGFDLEKDERELHAAYNDAQGVTADFNRNVLRVVNARLGADFVPEQFEHVAFFDRRRHWVEMRLAARASCRVRVPRAGIEVDFERGDEIRTEISCKYTRASVEALVRGTGLAIERWVTDGGDRFALALLRPTDGDGHDR